MTRITSLYDDFIGPDFTEVWEYAKEKHAGRVRKEGDREVPQHDHLAEVYFLLMKAVEKTPDWVFDNLLTLGEKSFKPDYVKKAGPVIAGSVALLHDILEDTDVKPGEFMSHLDSMFPDEYVTASIFEIVVQLTNQYTKESYPHLNRARRKRLETDFIAISRYKNTIWSVKGCDHISNYASIRKYDPNFAPVYRSELEYSLSRLWNGMIPCIREDLKELLSTGRSDLLFEVKMDKLQWTN